MVDRAGKKCSVHRIWSPGPHPGGAHCAKCRKPILWGELYRNTSGGFDRPVHDRCQPRVKKPKADAVQVWLF